MSNVLNDEAQKAELEKIEKIKLSLDKVNNKESKFLFFVPESQNPTASVYEVYFNATVVKGMGYKTYIMTENDEYEVPKWIDSEVSDHEHISMAGNKLSVGPEDIMVIPEVFSNVMEQVKDMPCTKVGLLQSVDYMMNGLVPGTDWSSFNVSDVITTSKTLKEFVETFYGKDKFDIKVYNPGVPDYFKRTDEPQKPIISVVGRNPNEVSKLVKIFFSRYPQYSWVTFDPLLTKSKPPQQMRRKDYAERLRGNFAAIWVDRISSWGTFPLECMKSGVIPIALVPDITPEYLIERDENGDAVKMKDNIGIWTDNFYDIPLLTGEVIIKYLDDTIGDELYDNMEKIASEFSHENSTKQLVEVYNGLLDKRKELFLSAIEPKEDKA